MKSGKHGRTKILTSEAIIANDETIYEDQDIPTEEPNQPMNLQESCGNDMNAVKAKKKKSRSITTHTKTRSEM